jgi:hypothetical protein
MAQGVFGKAKRFRELRAPIDAFPPGPHVIGDDQLALLRRNFAKAPLKARVAGFNLLGRLLGYVGNEPLIGGRRNRG